ncbi:MAG: hypothetical protein ACYCOO_10460 [Chitinophagaceae bacterium]
MKLNFHFFVWLFLWCSISAFSMGQNVSVRSSLDTSHSQLFPHSIHLITSWGGLQGGTVPLSVLQVLVDSSLSVRDSMQHLYRVISFNFGFMREDTSFNDSTSSLQLVKDYRNYYFDSNQLSPIWKEEIKKHARSGEKIYFDEVIASDPNQPFHFLAPSLEFRIR